MSDSADQDSRKWGLKTLLYVLVTSEKKILLRCSQHLIEFLEQYMNALGTDSSSDAMNLEPLVLVFLPSGCIDCVSVGMEGIVSISPAILLFGRLLETRVPKR